MKHWKILAILFIIFIATGVVFAFLDPVLDYHQNYWLNFKGSTIQISALVLLFTFFLAQTFESISLGKCMKYIAMFFLLIAITNLPTFALITYELIRELLKG
jgi:membrane protease YdiL (CAAX protease family)